MAKLKKNPWLAMKEIVNLVFYKPEKSTISADFFGPCGCCRGQNLISKMRGRYRS